MSNITRLAVFTLLWMVAVPGEIRARQATATNQQFLGSTIEFANRETGQALIGEVDAFVRNLSDFDRAARLNSPEKVDQDRFLAHAVEQVLDWAAEDIKKFSKIISRLEAQVRQLGLSLSLPPEIMIIKTTGREEAGPGAPYTRGVAIVIPAQVVDSGNEDDLVKLFSHELFHVMTRHQPEIRIPLYQLIGFENCGEIDYPDQLRDRKLTNPDAFHFDSYIELEIDNRPAKVIPLTLARSTPYEKGGVIANVSIEFLELEEEDNQLQPKMSDGKPVLHSVQSVAGSYLQKVGRNTNYIIHPEEILADNFAMAVMQRENAPSPEIPQGIIKILAGGKESSESDR